MMKVLLEDSLHYDLYIGRDEEQLVSLTHFMPLLKSIIGLNCLSLDGLAPFSLNCVYSEESTVDFSVAYS